MNLDRLDHLVLTVRDIERTCAFYERVLGMSRQSFAKGRVALHFGDQKINLHPYPSPIDPKAAVPEPGSVDLCFITEAPIDEVVDHLRAQGIEIDVGPRTTAGALGPMTSVYVRDPDGNLIEIANYQNT
jgi:catechol 2,3-dioxygenase-like lactoylglutathione lyase family enzyme